MRKILYIAAAALLCASCFQVNTNYTGGRNAVKGTGSVISKTMDFKKEMQELLHEDSIVNRPKPIEIDTITESLETTDYEYEDEF